ncbi:MAG: sigma-70 family RNA polymerase sigma factor [Alphaproteobacteria bacterium]
MTSGPAGTPDPAGRFEPHRRYLLGLAYRMLGSFAEAEDAVQDAYLRWHDASAKGGIDDARAYLARTVARLCLDRLKSAHARRESYVGPWLPDPVLDEAGLVADEPHGEYANDLSVALLLTLERLSPLERAAFLLHDVFDMPFAEIAATLGRSEAACRQLAGRAREHVRAGRPRYRASDEARQRLVLAFAAAVQSGDANEIARHLAADAVFYSDGGGKVPAALNPIEGADKVARLIVGLATKFAMPPGTSARFAHINGLPGFVIAGPDGPFQTVAFEIGDDGLIGAIYTVRNPDKLRHLH